MSRSHLERLGGVVATAIPRDSDGYIDRECPSADCHREFKILPGTGLKEPAPCICPYCGHSAESTEFTTETQRTYAIENAKAQVREAFQSDLRDMVGKLRASAPRGGMISVSFELKTSPIRRPFYGHHELETKLVCPKCDLFYAIFGKFAFCPDCGAHNSRQMFEVNLALVEKQLQIAANSFDPDLQRHLVENSLEDVVSAFDGFGRELIRVKASKIGQPTKADGLSFRSLAGAERRLLKDFSLSLDSLFDSGDYDFASRMFLQRHILAHKMGVIDAEYVSKSGDTAARVGHRLNPKSEEIRRLSTVLQGVANRLEGSL